MIRCFSELPSRAELLIERLSELAPASPPEDVPGRPIVLYGAGNLGRMVASFLDSLGVAIEAVVDASAENASSYWSHRGIRVRGPDELPERLRRHSRVLVCIATQPVCPIIDALKAKGFAEALPAYDYLELWSSRIPLRNGWFTGGFSEAELEELSALLEAFGDRESAAHHAAFVAWHHAREEWIFEGAPVCISNRYLPIEIETVLRPGERLLDVGAHHGELIRGLAVRGPETLGEVWAIEPDTDNAKVLRTTLAHLPCKHTTVFESPVDASRRRGYFRSGLGYASQLVESGGTEVEVTTIDELGLNPTWIKLHLEGGELGALRGAQETIRRHRPIVCATIYHDRKGMIDTPRWLAQSLVDYSLIVRRHAYAGTAVVAYAIPMERKLSP